MTPPFPVLFPLMDKVPVVWKVQDFSLTLGSLTFEAKESSIYCNLKGQTPKVITPEIFKAF